MTPAVYEFVASVQQQPQENGPEGSTEAAGSLKNEERIIPDIIFNLEDFEKHLIQITCYGGFLLFTKLHVRGLQVHHVHTVVCGMLKVQPCSVWLFVARFLPEDAFAEVWSMW